MGDEVSKSAEGRVNKSVERGYRLKGKEKNNKKTIEVSVASVRSVDEMWEVLYESMEREEREQRSQDRTYIAPCIVMGIILQLCGSVDLPMLYGVQPILRVIGVVWGVCGIAGLVLGWVDTYCKLEYFRLARLGVVASVMLSFLCGNVQQGVFLASLLVIILLIMRISTEGSKRNQVFEIWSRGSGDIDVKGVTAETAAEWQKLIQDMKSKGKVNKHLEEEKENGKK